MQPSERPIAAKLHLQLGRYGLVGVINTLAGLSTIAVMTYGGFGPYIANAAGYVAGLSTSYILNKHYTFEARSENSNLLAFGAAFAVSYSLNVLVLYLSIPLEVYHRLLPQLLATSAYSAIFFVLMKWFVFVSHEK
ncbi:MAG: GtrA family protein [Hoeflea sp.]|uniref:GtrA family protein n=1 Tax=Hoeflea sp. TaxID=1940281 RepID=UPI0032ED12AF